jgi:transposase
MISLAPGTIMYLACRPVDLRNGFDGLAAKAQQIIGEDPFSGHCQGNLVWRPCWR